MLVANCGACHNPTFGGNNGALEDVADLDQLVGDEWLLAGEAESSKLFARMAAGEMPPPAIEPRPSDADLALLVDTVNNCYVKTCTPPTEKIDTGAVLDAILFDLNVADINDQPFYRYFSIAHLYNAGYCPEQLESYRQGVSKLINALSSEAQIEAVTAIDQNETILRIDIREYGWDEPVQLFDDKWEGLVANSPYAVELLEDQAVTIKALAQTNVPFLLGDAFIDFASQPGAGDVAFGNGTDIGYHEFANVPTFANNDQDAVDNLEFILGLEIDDDIADEDVWRAGFTNSGVSAQNRIIERHEVPIANNHVMWISYDFADDSIAEQNIFASPLDFEEAGGEAIYSLPNGLHAYMLFEADGTRLDIGPDNIVVDPNQEDGNVLNGLSCHGCHGVFFTNGPDEVRDFVLNGTDFDADTKDIVREIYPPAEEFAALIVNDNEVYHRALEVAGVDPTSAIEPVTFAFHTFEKNVNLALAAAELGIAEQSLITQIGALDLALSPLISGSVKRDVWTSLYADTICKLNIGLANDDDCL